MTFNYLCQGIYVLYPAFVSLSVGLSVSNFTQKLLIGCSQKFYQRTKKNWLNFGSHPYLHPDLGIF